MNPSPTELHFDNAGMREGRRRIILSQKFPAITSFGRIEVPARFVSDGASIPMAAWSIIGYPFGEYLEESVVHDYLYSSQNKDITRAEADLILKELMWNTGISRWKIMAFYLAVRMFGGKNFKSNANA